MDHYSNGGPLISGGKKKKRLKFRLLIAVLLMGFLLVEKILKGMVRMALESILRTEMLRPWLPLGPIP